jgi:hypothetical protein
MPVPRTPTFIVAPSVDGVRQGTVSRLFHCGVASSQRDGEISFASVRERRSTGALYSAVVLPEDTPIRFSRPSKSNAVEGKDRCRVVRVASCNNSLDARLIERPGHQCRSRLACVSATAAVRDDAVADFEDARCVRWPEEADVADYGRAFPFDDHPHPISLVLGRRGRLDR